MNITSIIKNVSISGLFIYAGYHIHQNSVPGAIGWKIAGGVLTVFWAVRVAYRLNKRYKNVKKNYKDVKQKTGGKISIKDINDIGAASLPDWALGYYSVEMQMYKYAWRAMTFAPIQSEGGFCTQVAATKGLRAALSSVIVLVLGAWSSNGILAWLGTGLGGVISAVVAAGLSLYVVTWILGDWRATKDVAHQVDDDKLVLQLGVRSAVTLPFSAIARCTQLSDARAVASAAEAGAPLDMTAGAAANVLVELRSKQALVITRLGYPVPSTTSRIALRLVNPEKFVGLVTQKLQATAPGPIEQQVA